MEASQSTIIDDHYLAAMVRAALLRSGKSQAALARELDVTEHYLSRRMRGEVPFSAVELATIAEVLGVRVEAFYGRAA